MRGGQLGKISMKAGGGEEEGEGTKWRKKGLRNTAIVNYSSRHVCP